jgi:hypothetical protein
MLRVLALICVSVAVLGPVTLVRGEDLADRWKCAVYLREVSTRDGQIHVQSGSGLLLRAESRVYLVTAGHVADWATENTQVLVSSESVCLNLGLSRSNGWLRRAGHDVAVLPTTGQRIADASCLNIESCQRESPAIKTELEFVGFPFSLGVSEGQSLAPLVVEGRVASRELNASLDDTVDRAILASPAVANGTSGGPVFGHSADGEWNLVGIATGKLIDPTGAKLSKLASVRVVLEMVAEHGEVATARTAEVEGAAGNVR